MSQQRSCCCGEEQKFGLECLHGDKMSPRAGTRKQNTLNANYRPGSLYPAGWLNTYKTGKQTKHTSVFQSTAQDHTDAFVQADIDTSETSGMGCMLCHGSLIMSFKAKSFTTSGCLVQSNFCGGGNCEGDARKIQRYNCNSNNFPGEERMSVLYLAVRDFWYFERGPSGVPYSVFSSSISRQEAFARGQEVNDIPYFTRDALGKREPGGHQEFPEIACGSFTPWLYPTLPTDGDRLCSPELTRVTNPANVDFVRQTEDGPGIPSLGQMQRAFDATKGCGNENRSPELANYNVMGPCANNLDAQNFVCSGLYSNSHPWASQYGTPGWTPCFGLYAPGFSSWQMYQMRNNPAVRHLSDITTFGNGVRLFRTPGDAIFDEDPAPNLYANAYGAYYGNLYRVRLWTRADKYVDSQYRFPCTSYNGETVSHYPPETNSRLRRSTDTGGYTPEQKACASGPTMLMYACSGTPVFTSDIYDALNDSDANFPEAIARKLNNYYWGRDLSGGGYDEDCGVLGCAEGYHECTVVPGIEDPLGETGKFTVKDWRSDQTAKYAELESGFRSKAAETLEELEGKLNENDRQALETFKTIDLPSSIKNRFAPREVGGIPELLPVQKTGREMLTCFINRKRPKERADGEKGDVRLTEMGEYQGSDFDGSNFDIDFIDPWHPKNNSTSDTGWPRLGEERQQKYPVVLGYPDGETERFEFRYPVRVAYESEFGGLSDEAWDEIAPPWERELFELWYKKNPLYFHAIPGGWAWSGSGFSHRPRLTKKQITDPVPDRNWCRWANQLYRLGQVDSIHQIAKFDSNSSYSGTCDAFPNYSWFDVNLGFPMESRQLRNKPRVSTCFPIAERCMGFENYVADVNDCGGDGGDCCPVSSIRAAQAHPCNDNGDGNCAGGRGVNIGQVQINCCNRWRSYSGTRRGIGDPFKPTSSVVHSQPTTVVTDSNPNEKRAWNELNPSTQIGDSALYGSRCSESGRCPTGYQCCCTSGCDGDCICIPESLNCPSPPCTKQNDFASDCCAKFGSCCYEDENGSLRCIDNVSEEECISRTEFDGLNGTFYQDRTCLSGPCKTTVTRGACFYEDKFLDHQICRQTTSDTCAGLSGEFHANKECSEFSGRETTGYQKVYSDVNAKPQFVGDRSCGQYGFTVNCCTETTDKKTGVVTRTCEIKCMSDCDHENSRIVETCDSCGELGHCCVPSGYKGWRGVCIPRISEVDCIARNGKWSTGRECDENSCVVYPPDTADDVSVGSYPEFRGGGGGPGGTDGGGGGALGGCPSCNQPIFGRTLALCNVSDRISLAGHNSPTKPGSGVPWACTIAKNAAIKQCISRHIQVTKIGFRHLIFNSAQDFSPNGNACPSASNKCTCCECSANSAMCGFGPGGDLTCSGCSQGDFDQSFPIHAALSSLEVTIYPYKIRCRQLLTDAGLWRCQELDSHIFPSQTRDFAVGIAGITDYKVCHNTLRYALNTTCPGGNKCGEEDAFHCVFRESGTCYGQGNDTCSDEAEYKSSFFYAPCCAPRYDAIFTAREAHLGSKCPNLASAGRFTAKSIRFPGETNVSQHIYSPSYGVSDIPASHCLSGGYEKPLDRIPPSVTNESTFKRCAEYYNDKLLTDIDDGLYEDPEPLTDLIFHDFGGLTAGGVENSAGSCVDGDDPRRNWFRGANAEFVDAQFTGEPNSNEFWIKKEFPGLEYIRIFGAGCYNIPGSYEGGLGIDLPDYNQTTHPDGVSAGGNFAGTMVLVFGNTSEFQRFDEIYGSENLSLQFVTPVTGQPAEFPLGTEQSRYKFVAQPSFNIRKSPDLDINCGPGPTPDGVRCTYSEIGFINGRGLTFANVQNYSVEVNNTIPPTATTNGGTGPEVGKVYEFCSYVAPNSLQLPQGDPLQTENDSAAKLKPVFVGGNNPPDAVPFFSGVRGPLVLYNRENPFTTVLKRFDVNQGLLIDGAYGQCFGLTFNEETGEDEALLEIFNDELGERIVTREDCVIGATTGQPNGNEFFPYVDGINNNGAKGCCMHDKDDPLLTDDELDPDTLSDPLPDDPCMYWWQIGSDDPYHDNPDRTAGGGDCVCP